ncbi:sensor histidine kinase [Brevundimonas sp.]|uniref:sensor histidine kinase n=1 Tax=Brevundimonas sp. TaxID=1871086 RepID=UPI003A93055C
MTMFANLPGRDLWNRRGTGLCLALTALVLVLALRLVPGAGDRVWLLPLVGLALVPAALPGRGRVLAGMGLSILAALLILPATDGIEGMINVLLLAVAALLLGGIGEDLRGVPVARLKARLDRRWHASAIGEMTAILAHELTQPLTAATAYLQAGQTELKRAGGTLPTLDLVRAQLLRAGQLIDELRGRLIPKSGERRPERVSQLIAALEPIMTAMGAADGVVVSVRVDARGDLVLADGIQIQQAMLNLVRNAITSVAGRSERTVVIRGRIISTDQYEIAVEDTGPGITPEAWNLTLHPARNNVLDGRGLGLSVSRSILKTHGSDLAVSASGAGRSGFHFSLARVAGRGASL